ncbi:MAG: cytochrome c [Chloroflexota bacterium]
MLNRTFAIGLLVILATGIAGCQSTTPPAPTTPSPPPSSAPTPPAIGEVARAGETVYANYCTSCHGNSGGGRVGPAVIGSAAALGKYNTAQGLLDYIAATMPKSNPGGLSHQDYLNVVSFLIVRNNYLPEDAAFLESRLDSVALR